MAVVARKPKEVVERSPADTRDVVITRKQAERIMRREACQLGSSSVRKAVRDAKSGKYHGKLEATKLLMMDKLVGGA